MNKIYKTKNLEETQNLGKKLAKEVLEKNGPVILALTGNLGGGKTIFLQGFAKGLGIKEKILSPTFVIQKRFSAPGGSVSGWKNFYHIDCYRINKPEEILELGWKEIIDNPKNIIAIEWPEKIKKFLPKNIIKIEFKFIDENKREIIFKM